MNLEPGRGLCWALTTGEAGHQSQAIGIAEAIGYPAPVNKVVRVAKPWSWAPVGLLPTPVSAIEGEGITPPWPELIVCCGRRAALAALAIKRAAGGRPKLVCVMDPRAGRARFDVLVVPEHDPVRGANVVVTQGAPHRVTRARLAAAAAEFAALADGLPRPLLAVLIGGSNGVYHLDSDWAAGFGRRLRALGCGLLVTASRRTGESAALSLSAALAGSPHRFWSPWTDGAGPNPYFGYLALADQILVTSDSVSMISEACATGLPVLVERLPARGDRAKFEQFHQRLIDKKLINWFNNEPQSWPNGRLDDMDALGDELRGRLHIAGRAKVSQ